MLLLCFSQQLTEKKVENNNEDFLPLLLKYITQSNIKIDLNDYRRFSSP